LNPNPFLGVVLHALGGFAAGSFYIPFKRVQKWAWESYWLVGGFFSWVIAPWVVALLVCRGNLWPILSHAPAKSLVWSYVFGVLWGIGGLTFGLTMRYLGMSLGYAIALGFCAAFGTLIPPIVKGQFIELLRHPSGLVAVAGYAICLGGIAVCGKAGSEKERELSPEQKKASIREFNFAKGLGVAIFAGIMSAFMAFAIDAGKPIAELAVKRNTPELWQYSPVYILTFAGGFTTNFIWCALLNYHNRSAGDYVSGHGASLAVNYVFSALAGITWYCQFMFFGMGKTNMGRYDFSSWTIHMAFIIAFSNIWALIFREWKGASRRTHNVIIAGISVLVASTLVVGYGNYLAKLEDEAARSRERTAYVHVQRATLDSSQPSPAGPGAGRPRRQPDRHP